MKKVLILNVVSLGMLCLVIFLSTKMEPNTHPTLWQYIEMGLLIRIFNSILEKEQNNED